jgi:hypothetical protein
MIDLDGKSRNRVDNYETTPRCCHFVWEKIILNWLLTLFTPVR